MRSPCSSCVHMSVCPLYQPLNTSTSLYETWYLYQNTWAHLNGVLHKSLPLVCVALCVSLQSLLGNGSVKTIQRQRTRNSTRLIERIVSNESIPELLV
jgi:hypothetical protein